MLTTPEKTFAIARTAGSAAGSAWAKLDVDLANAKTHVPTPNQIFAVAICAVQVTELPQHCQLGSGSVATSLCDVARTCYSHVATSLAAVLNGCRLNVPCPVQSPLELVCT